MVPPASDIVEPAACALNVMEPVPAVNVWLLLRARVSLLVPFMEMVIADAA